MCEEVLFEIPNYALKARGFNKQITLCNGKEVAAIFLKF